MTEPQVLTPKRTEFGKKIRKEYEAHKVDMSRHDMTTMEPRNDGISNTLTSVQKDNYVAEPISVAMRGRNPNNPSERGKSNGNYKQRLEMNQSGVANTITSVQKDSMVAEPTYRIRKLTPRECFRLMGVDDTDIDKIQASGLSNARQYQCAGNSIVVDTLYHIFRKAFCETHNENQQQTLF